jgi:hypothetical protein
LPETIKKITSVIFYSVSKLWGNTELLGECKGLGSGIVSVEKGCDISFNSSRFGLEVGIRCPGWIDATREHFLNELKHENDLEQ